MPHHIYSTHALHPKAEARLATAGAFQVASALDAATLAREGAQADIVIVRANIPAELFARQRSLRAAIRHGAGLDMIPLEAATGNMRDAFDEAISVREIPSESLDLVQIATMWA